MAHIHPTSYNASHVRRVTFAPQVPQIIPRHVQRIAVNNPCVNQVQNATTIIRALWDTSVPGHQPSLYLALLAPLATSLVLGQVATVTHVQPGRSTTCPLRRPVSPAAAPPPRRPVRSYFINNVQ